MPVLQMRKLRPQLSQDVLTWRQGGPGPSMADCLRPAWRTCSMPPPPALGQRGVAETPQRGCAWVLQQGQAGTSSRPLPASWRFPGCLPPPEEGSLLSELISCQLSVFFVFAATSGKQMGWGGQRNRISRAGPSQGWGPLPWALLP